MTSGQSFNTKTFTNPTLSAWEVFMKAASVMVFLQNTLNLKFNRKQENIITGPSVSTFIFR